MRQLLPMLGTLLIALGVVKADQWAAWSTIIMLAIGPAFLIGSIIWSFVANSKKSILTSASNMPEVNKIELKREEPGSSELNKATPANVVVVTTAPGKV